MKLNPHGNALIINNKTRPRRGHTTIKARQTGSAASHAGLVQNATTRENGRKYNNPEMKDETTVIQAPTTRKWKTR